MFWGPEGGGLESILSHRVEFAKGARIAVLHCANSKIDPTGSRFHSSEIDGPIKSVYEKIRWISVPEEPN
jgi:hypothetical protein